MFFSNIYSQKLPISFAKFYFLWNAMQGKVWYIWWNYRNAYLGMQSRWLIAILYFLHELLLKIISKKTYVIFLYFKKNFEIEKLSIEDVKLECVTQDITGLAGTCENFKPWFCSGLLLKNKIGVEILKHGNWDLHFCSSTVNMVIRYAWELLSLCCVY